MSSSESNSSSEIPTAPKDEKPGSPVAMVVLTLALLAGLVWAMAPRRSKYSPAPLRPVPPDCPKNLPDFVPSDATEIPGVDLRSLTKLQRNRVLYRLNMEPCPCGCNLSIAACRIGHPTCPVCKSLVEKMIAEESGGSSQVSGVRSQK